LKSHFEALTVSILRWILKAERKIVYRDVLAQNDEAGMEKPQTSA